MFLLTSLYSALDSPDRLINFVIEIGCKQKLIDNITSIGKVCNQSFFYLQRLAAIDRTEI